MIASWLERVIATLIRLHPRDYASEYAADMIETFRARAANARRRGRRAYATFVLRELAALVASALTQRFVVRGSSGSVEVDDGHARTHALREMRYAARRLLRTPTFVVAATLTLGLAIGAHTAVFTLVQRVVIAPLPYPAADRLVALDHTAPGMGIPAGMGMSIGLYREYAKLPAIEAIALYTMREGTVSADGNPVRAEFLQATPSLGGLAGLRPLLGRWFAEADGIAGSPDVVVLSDATWRSWFGASPNVIGTALLVEGRSHEIVGILPPGVSFPDPRAQFVLPLPLPIEWTRAAGFNYQGLARLAAGVGIDDARHQQNAVIAKLPTLYPADPEAASTVGTAKLASIPQPLKRQVLGDTTTTLWALLGASAVVLLMACANLANLVLVRADARQREVTLRRALGAGSSNIVAYFLSETVLIGIAGGVLGLAVGWAAVGLLVRVAPVELPRLHEVRVGAVGVGFSVAISLLSGLVLGLVPVIRHAMARPSPLVDSERAGTSGRRRMRTRHVLMAAQMSLAVVLLSAAGLMVRSFFNLVRVDPGFSAESRLVFRVGLPQREYRSRADAAAFHAGMLDRLRALPGVRGAALTSTLPLEGQGLGDPLEVEGRPVGSVDATPIVRFRRVSNEYFATMRIPLRGGRLFDQPDADGTTASVLVNEALVRLYFGAADPIGRRIRPIEGDSLGRWLTIVGVVGNTVTEKLHEPASVATMYVPLRGSMWADVPAPHTVTYVLEVDGNPIGQVPSVRRVLEGLNPRVTIARPERLTDLTARARASHSFTMVLLVVAATLALVVGLVGVYAVISYGVAQRTVEIGLRLAVGATPGDVTAMIVRQSGKVVVTGLALGVLGALATGRLLQAMLFGVGPRDLATHVVVGVLLLVVATAACWWPAHRAAQCNPLESLRGG